MMQGMVRSNITAILDKMVRYDYRQRYRDASEALQALEQFRQHTQPDEPITHSQALVVPTTHPQSPITDHQTPTLPLSSPQTLDEPEGQVSLNSSFYVERPPVESDCYDAIIKPGALIRVKAPRQMGKTSLMSRILNHASQQGYRTVCLNFQSASGASGTLSNRPRKDDIREVAASRADRRRTFL